MSSLEKCLFRSSAHLVGCLLLFLAVCLIIKHSHIHGLQYSIIISLLKLLQLWPLRDFDVSPSFLDLFSTHWNFSIIQAHSLSVPAFRVTICLRSSDFFYWRMTFRKEDVGACCYWGLRCSRVWVRMHIRIVTNANVFISLYLCVCILSLYWYCWFPPNKH